VGVEPGAYVDGKGWVGIDGAPEVINERGTAVGLVDARLKETLGSPEEVALAAPERGTDTEEVGIPEAAAVVVPAGCVEVVGRAAMDELDVAGADDDAEEVATEVDEDGGGACLRCLSPRPS